MIWTVSIVSFLIGLGAGVALGVEHVNDNVNKLHERISFMESAYTCMNNRIVDIEHGD